MAGRAARARSVVVSLLPLLLLAVSVPQASATLRVESTTRGLVAEDLNGTFNDFVQLRLVQTGIRLEWELEKSLVCGTACFDLVRFEFGPGCRAEGDRARCDRITPGATLRLSGGNDTVLNFDSPVPITDPLTLDMGAGRDNADGALGNDTILAGSGDDSLEGFTGDDVLDGGSGDDLISLGEGADRAEGGAGNDGFSVSTPLRDGTDIVNGGLGADSADYAGRTTPMRDHRGQSADPGGRAGHGRERRAHVDRALRRRQRRRHHHGGAVIEHQHLRGVRRRRSTLRYQRRQHAHRGSGQRSARRQRRGRRDRRQVRRDPQRVTCGRGHRLRHRCE